MACLSAFRQAAVKHDMSAGQRLGTDVERTRNDKGDPNQTVLTPDSKNLLARLQGMVETFEGNVEEGAPRGFVRVLVTK